jgi:glycosyltransferase involved in cell wall biosynthesis
MMEESRDESSGQIGHPSSFILHPSSFRRKPAVLFDLTEFLREPLRSGIQRVSYELVRHWCGRYPLVPARIGTDRTLLVLPDEIIPRLHAWFANTEDAAEARSWLLQAGREFGTPVEATPWTPAALLNTEVFCAENQVAFYEERLRSDPADRIFFLVYDLLPWLAPRWFHQAIVTFPLAYLRLLRSVRHLAFISGQVRCDFRSRILRAPPGLEAPTGPVLPLGSDGLGTAAPAFQSGNQRFSVIGTLEPRKNVLGVLEAFEPLWAEGHAVELVLAGRMGWLPDPERERILSLARTEARFTWLDRPTDEEIRALIRSSRATIYASWAEGFGLPPLESLALGVPVIVTASLPSVADLPPWGQVRVEQPTPAALQAAVRCLLDDDFARARYDEIPQLRLPTWSGFARGVASWIADCGLQIAD